MYPAKSAALLYYLVLCQIDCDMLRRQKSRLIQSYFSWAQCSMQSKGAAVPHDITRSLFTRPFHGLFFFQITLLKINWHEKSKSWIFNISSPIVQIAVDILSLMFNNREWKAESFILFCVAFYITVEQKRYSCSICKQWQWGLLYSICTHECLHIKSTGTFGSCMRSVVILKPKLCLPRPLLKFSD